MGWDYYVFMAQPATFVEEILLIMKQEGEKAKSDAKKAQRKTK